MARTKRGADGESRPNDPSTPAAMPSSQEVDKQYETASQVFGRKKPTLSVAEGTRKLANELNEFQAKSGQQAAATYNNVSDDAVEALQLQTCRKLRQVCYDDCCFLV